MIEGVPVEDDTITPLSDRIKINISKSKVIGIAVSMVAIMSVSYTHLTLPTKRIV